MIYSSLPWKRDLLRRKQLFMRYNTVEQFEKDEEAAYTVLEKAVFYSAFIIRKMIDCDVKVSDDVDHYTLQVKKYIPTKNVTRSNRWADNNTYDWNRPNQETVKGKDVCNWLIHSYVFMFGYNEAGIIVGFFVSSDFDRNKALYYIDIHDWLVYLDFVSSDDIALLEQQYDDKCKDFVAVRKDRVKKYSSKDAIRIIV